MAVLKINRPSAAAPLAPEREVAQLWLNIGYEASVDVYENGVFVRSEMQFISLALGIPLDTMKDVPVPKHNPNNGPYVDLCKARNGLKEQLVEIGMSYAPGEARFITAASPDGLRLQMRRIGQEEPTSDSADNPFAKKISLISV